MKTLANFVVLVAAAASAAPPHVEITSPRAATPAFGAVQFAVAVTSEEAVARVRFVVDGRPVGERTQPPYSIITMLADENVEHTFRAEAVTASGVSGSAEVRTPVFRSNQEVEIELRQLYVRVTERRADGKPGAAPAAERQVADLKREQFTVLDDGKEQTIRTFASGETPIAAVVLLDASLSMAGERLKAALDGAKTFFRAMAPLDEGRLIVFSDRVLHASPFTTVSDVLLTGLDGIRAQGGTALNDHLYLALRDADQRQGRRVVILLSDGVDSHSAMPMTEVRQAARSSQAIVYWIRMNDLGHAADEAPSLTSTWRDRKSHRREFEELGETVRESGGRIVPVSSLDRIEPAFAEILRELRGQFVLGYYPTERRHDDSWHRVVVKVDDPAYLVHTRDGYLDY
ncbi:MAG TPA: VWA domain-containing protein [Thermoanaerobaculaceae bacterium]|nr:VWA domain-containing protein [Thermoanaerobaculaceae bacterium]